MLSISTSVAIVLLAQTGSRTYSEGFSLRWDQVDLEKGLIFLSGNVKTPGSAEPIPLTEMACAVLRKWKEATGNRSPFLFPSPLNSSRPITTVKKSWRSTLKKAGVAHFPIYNLRHVFCTRLSWVAADAVVERAMRHVSPDTKRLYQLGMAEQVRQSVERANDRVYGQTGVLHLYDTVGEKEAEQENAVRK